MGCVHCHPYIEGPQGNNPTGTNSFQVGGRWVVEDKRIDAVLEGVMRILCHFNSFAGGMRSKEASRPRVLHTTLCVHVDHEMHERAEKW